MSINSQCIYGAIFLFIKPLFDLVKVSDGNTKTMFNTVDRRVGFILYSYMNTCLSTDRWWIRKSMLCHICTVFSCEDALPALSCRGQCFAALQSIRCLNLASDTKTLPADIRPFLQRPLQQTHRVVPVSPADTTGCQKNAAAWLWQTWAHTVHLCHLHCPTVKCYLTLWLTERMLHTDLWELFPTRSWRVCRATVSLIFSGFSVSCARRETRRDECFPTFFWLL